MEEGEGIAHGTESEKAVAQSPLFVSYVSILNNVELNDCWIDRERKTNFVCWIRSAKANIIIYFIYTKYKDNVIVVKTYIIVIECLWRNGRTVKHKAQEDKRIQIQMQSCPCINDVPQDSEKVRIERMNQGCRYMIQIVNIGCVLTLATSDSIFVRS